MLGANDLVCQEDKSNRAFSKALGHYSRKLLAITATGSYLLLGESYQVRHVGG